MFNKIEFNKYKNLFLVEVEKSLRRLRVVSLKMDRISDSLIKKIRTIHINTSLARDKKDIDKLISSKVSIPVTNFSLNHKKNELDLLRREEQKLLIEIAKNPKNPLLYESLGDLYIRMNNNNDAKESYNAALELNPNSEILLKKRSQIS